MSAEECTAAGGFVSDDLCIVVDPAPLDPTVQVPASPPLTELPNTGAGIDGALVGLALFVAGIALVIRSGVTA